MELINPLGPDMDQCATAAVWDALKDLCHGRGLDFHKCKDDIVTIRAETPDLDRQSQAMISMDLCRYMRDGLQM